MAALCVQLAEAELHELPKWTCLLTDSLYHPWMGTVVEEILLMIRSNPNSELWQKFTISQNGHRLWKSFKQQFLGRKWPLAVSLWLTWSSCLWLFCNCLASSSTTPPAFPDEGRLWLCLWGPSPPTPSNSPHRPGCTENHVTNVETNSEIEQCVLRPHT